MSTDCVLKYGLLATAGVLPLDEFAHLESLPKQERIKE
jgi:hypothetical protein